MQEISVYLNKKAGSGQGEWWEKEISRRLFRSTINFRKPKDYDDLLASLDKDIQSKVDTIISVGGDGTAHTIIQKMVGSDIALLVVPGGTANDLASELGAAKSVEQVISWVRSKEMKHIDLIRINGKLMATNGGLGVGSNIAKKLNELRNKIPLFQRVMKYTGKNIYSFLAATEFIGLEMPQYKFLIESDKYNGLLECPGVLVNNQPLLGGRFNVAPQTENTDGLFNVTAFTHKSKRRLIQCLWNMASGKNVHEFDPYIISFETKKLKITLQDENIEGLKNSGELSFFGDGEIFAKGRSWDIEMVPSSLLVYGADGESSLLDTVNEVTLQ